jgi:uncharacterized sporulation protein YeaH/YhbH (DUF444 family)
VSEDEFAVILSREEFLKFFFEDLELPNMVQKFLENTETLRIKGLGTSSMATLRGSTLKAATSNRWPGK